MQPIPEKTTGSPRLATALAFALIVVALSGGHAAQAAGAMQGPHEARSDGDRTRQLAAVAVAATRDILGVDQARPASVPRSSSALIERHGRSQVCRYDDVDAGPLLRPAPRLTNLPPPRR